MILFYHFRLLLASSARPYAEIVGLDVQNACYILVLHKYMVARQYAYAAE